MENKYSLDDRAQLLEAVAKGDRGIRQMTEHVKWTPSHVISLLRKMEDEGLITEAKSSGARASNRGRPKKIMTCTPLGLDFLETYRRLDMKPLKARKEDLERAVRDALYAERLEANGHSTFKLFMELNSIARNIEISSQTP